MTIRKRSGPTTELGCCPTQLGCQSTHRSCMFALDLEPTARNRFDNKTGQEEGQLLGLAEKPPMLRPAGRRESNSPEPRLCQNCPFHSSACTALDWIKGDHKRTAMQPFNSQSLQMRPSRLHIQLKIFSRLKTLTSRRVSLDSGQTAIAVTPASVSFPLLSIPLPFPSHFPLLNCLHCFLISVI